MITIHKYGVPTNTFSGLSADGCFSIMMPKDADILTIQLQRDVPQIWAVVETDAPIVERHFCLVGTGHNFPPRVLKNGYIGTFMLAGDRLVLHCFERHVE